MPVYNPQGVYLVKLWLNGVARRVIVDDFLPVDERGHLLCSHTMAAVSGKEQNNGSGSVLELWVPILVSIYLALKSLVWLYMYSLTCLFYDESEGKGVHEAMRRIRFPRLKLRRGHIQPDGVDT